MYGFGGLERWNGMVEWIGLEWNGMEWPENRCDSGRVRPLTLNLKLGPVTRAEKGCLDFSVNSKEP